MINPSSNGRGAIFGDNRSCAERRVSLIQNRKAKEAATMYAITGATGNKAKVIEERLLARGEKVRAIGRDADRLASLVPKGAEAFVADVTDSIAMARVFAGTKAAYVMIPPNFAAPDVGAYQEQVSEALARD